jgi:hypothetical protein
MVSTTNDCPWPGLPGCGSHGKEWRIKRNGWGKSSLPVRLGYFIRSGAEISFWSDTWSKSAVAARLRAFGCKTYCIYVSTPKLLFWRRRRSAFRTSQRKRMKYSRLGSGRGQTEFRRASSDLYVRLRIPHKSHGCIGQIRLARRILEIEARLVHVSCRFCRRTSTIVQLKPSDGTTDSNDSIIFRSEPDGLILIRGSIAACFARIGVIQ